MKYTLDSGRVIEIGDNAIRNLMDACECTKEEAIDIWLTDHDYIVNQEQEKLNKNAKNAGIRAESGTKTSKKPRKKVEIKVSDEKKALFNEISGFLKRVYGINTKIVTENKLISVQIGDKTFKIDVIQQRK